MSPDAICLISRNQPKGDTRVGMSGEAIGNSTTKPCQGSQKPSSAGDASRETLQLQPKLQMTDSNPNVGPGSSRLAASKVLPVPTLDKPSRGKDSCCPSVQTGKTESYSELLLAVLVNKMPQALDSFIHPFCNFQILSKPVVAHR